MTPFNLKSEKIRFPVNVIFSTSVIRPSIISNIKSTRLSDNSTIFGVIEADIRPVSAYAEAITSESFSVLEIERVWRSLEKINSDKFSSFNVLLPSKLIVLIVGFSITFIVNILLTNETVAVLKKVDFLISCRAEFNWDGLYKAPFSILEIAIIVSLVMRLFPSTIIEEIVPSWENDFVGKIENDKNNSISNGIMFKFWKNWFFLK